MDEVGHLIVLTGVPYGPGGETIWSYAYSPTYQEPAVMYLTGVNQNQALLLLDPHSRQSDEILFVPQKDPVKEFWDGVRFGAGSPKSIQETKRVTGLRDVRDIADFDKVFQERFSRQRNKKVGAFWLEGIRNGKKTRITGDHNWSFRKRLSGLLRKRNAPRGALVNIMKTHFDLRLPLDSYDAANALKANEITGRSFKATLRHFHHFKNEAQTKSFIEGNMLMHSPYGLSYPSIIASGPNAAVLHYMKDDDDIGRDELMLMDFGVRWMTMHADITRTVPASGKFNPMQKVLYEIVLKAQLEVESAAKAGETINKLNEICWDCVNHGLKHEFKAAGGICKLKYKNKPHGVSHLMGEQEHDGDPFRNYADALMQPGWMISNEPGLYGEFRWKYKGKVYDQEIGIRIEDNLLITDKSCRNLSKSIPKTVAEIERWMASGKRDKTPNPVALAGGL